MFEYILQYNNATIIKKIKIKLYLFYKYMLLLLWKEAMIKDQDDIISMNNMSILYSNDDYIWY